MHFSYQKVDSPNYLIIDAFLNYFLPLNINNGGVGAIVRNGEGRLLEAATRKISCFKNVALA